jgi:hypothetical protein
MQTRLRDLAVCAIAMVLLLLLAERLRWWSYDFVLYYLPQPSGWAYWPLAVMWLLDLGFFLVIGVALAASLRSRHAVWWSFSFGLIYGLLRIAIHELSLVPDVSWGLYVYVYWMFFVPCIGAAAGAGLFRLLWPTQRSMGTHAA